MIIEASLRPDSAHGVTFVRWTLISEAGVKLLVEPAGMTDIQLRLGARTMHLAQTWQVPLVRMTLSESCTHGWTHDQLALVPGLLPPHPRGGMSLNYSQLTYPLCSLAGFQLQQ